VQTKVHRGANREREITAPPFQIGWFEARNRMIPLILVELGVVCGDCLRLDDFAAAQTGSADADALALSVNLGVDRTQIDVPAPLGYVMGVADAVSRLRLLAADITLLRHD
jgi:hypothetical protein